MIQIRVCVKDPVSYPPGDVTQMLLDLKQGDRAAEGRLIPVVYDELRRIAAAHLRRESPQHSLQPTALVNEAYLRLANVRELDWQSRTHFFAVSATLMRRVLVDHARANHAAKRGESVSTLLIDENISPTPGRPPEIVALDDALTALEKFDQRMATIVELRFFAGMREKDIADKLNISDRTVKRDWQLARAWLYRELNAQG